LVWVFWISGWRADVDYWLSNIKLNTDNPFFLSAVPGLAELPNKDIHIDLRVGALPNATINATGVHFLNIPIVATFSLHNATYAHDGWTVESTVDVNLWIVAKFASAGPGDMTLGFSFSQSTIDITEITVQESSVGAVSVSKMEALWEQAAAAGFAQFSQIGFADLFFVGNLSSSVVFYDHFAALELHFDRIRFF